LAAPERLFGRLRSLRLREIVHRVLTRKSHSHPIPIWKLSNVNMEAPTAKLAEF